MSTLGHSLPRHRVLAATNVRYALPVQPVDATQALNLSAGVSNPRVLRGRPLSWRATLFRWACEYTDRSAPFGKYCLSRPLVFSLEPRCQRSQSSVFSAAVNPRKYPCRIAIHSIFPCQDRVLRRPVETTLHSDQILRGDEMTRCAM